MVNSRLARQQRIDHMVAEPVAKIADIVVGDYRDAAEVHRSLQSTGVSRIRICRLSTGIERAMRKP